MPSRVLMNYQEASKNCNSLGGKLYEPQTTSEQNAVKKFVFNQNLYHGKEKHGPFIGINDIENEGR